MKQLLPVLLLLHATAGARWQTVELSDTGVPRGASSSLDGTVPHAAGRYGAGAALDGQSASCWSEGAPGPGISETLYIPMPPGCSSLTIHNGYQKSPSLFRKNGRIRTAEVQICAAFNLEGVVSENAARFETTPLGGPVSLTLRDTMGPQSIPLELNWAAMRGAFDQACDEFLSREYTSRLAQSCWLLMLRITAVYPGSTYEDTCLSEILAPPPSYPPVTHAGVSDDGHTVLLTRAEKTRALITDPDSVFQILELSPDTNWLICIRMDSGGEGRHETSYRLYHLPTTRRVTDAELRTRPFVYYGFGGTPGTLLLETEDGDIPLKPVADRLTGY